MKKKPPSQSEMVRVWTRVIVRTFLIVASSILGAWVLYQLGTVILLLIFSIFFCYLVAPLVRITEQPIYVAGRELKIPRGLAILLVYIGIGLLLFLTIRLISPMMTQQVDDLKAQWPSLQADARSKFNDLSNWMQHLKLPEQLRNDLAERGNELVSSIGPWLGKLLLSAFGYLPYLLWLIIVPIFSFFLLKDAAKFEHGLVALLPNEKLRKRAHWLLEDVSKTLAAYIRAQITACIEIGILITVGFSIIGVPYAIVMGAVAGMLEFLPMIGPFTFAAVAFLLALTVSLKLALIVALFLAVLRILQDYIIYPRIVGQGIEMHPLVVIIAILSGFELGGLIGVFLSIPFVGLMIVVYNHYLAYRGRQGAAGPISAEQFERELQRPPQPELAPATTALEE
ncbi:MAG TPA: AI-2E family transporter [Blastocatellia bacterium]|nr:AI-2E family transporter [Blastocatellia bacterium]